MSGAAAGSGGAGTGGASTGGAGGASTAGASGASAGASGSTGCPPNVCVTNGLPAGTHCVGNSVVDCVMNTACLDAMETPCGPSSACIGTSCQPKYCEVYQNANYGGWKETFNVGEGFVDAPLRDNAISSVICFNTAVAHAWEGKNMTGTTWLLSGMVPDLKMSSYGDIGDQISSIVVE